MSFLRPPIMAGPVWPSVLTGICHINHTVFVFLFLFIFMYFIFIICNYSTTWSSGADWWIIDKPPVF